MADITSVDLARIAGEQLESARPDLLRAMLRAFAQALMDAVADQDGECPGVPGELRLAAADEHTIRTRTWKEFCRSGPGRLADLQLPPR
jgi:hypothetical protein